MQSTSEELLLKSKVPYKGLVAVASYVKKELLLFLLIFIFYGITAISNMFYAKIFEGIDEALASNDFRSSILIPVGIIIITLVRSISMAFGQLTASYIASTIAYQLSVKVYRHIIRLPIKFFDRSSVGEIMSKVNYNVGAISGAINGGFVVIIREGLTLVTILAYLFYLNWTLTLIIVSVFPLVGIVLELARRRLRVLSKRLKQGAEDISRTMADVFRSLILVRVFVAEQHEENRFKKFSRFQKRESIKATLVGVITNPLLQIIVSVPFAIVMYIGISGGANSFDDVGKLLAYLAGCSFLAAPLRSLSGVQGVIQAGEVSAYEYIHYISLKHEDDSGTIILNNKDVKGRIEFRNVVFGYDKEKPVIKDLNLVFEEGKKTALVGLSGSGKSTLVNLIMRLYETQQGSILLDGTDIKDIRLKSLRNNISYIGQEVFLFNNTLRYNLLYGNDNKYSDEEINKVLVNANVKGFVDEMSNGLDTRLGEKGIKLSGGQQQRLSIARSLLKNAHLIIMDEATSSLDVKNEYEIRNNIDALLSERTVIVIAHRLTTIEAMDKIVLLGNGQVLGEGTHEELLVSNSEYADLCSYQYKD